MAAHNLAPPKMPEQYKHPTNDPILESRHPKVFTEGHSESVGDFIYFCQKLAEMETLLLFFFPQKVSFSANL